MAKKQTPTKKSSVKKTKAETQTKSTAPTFDQLLEQHLVDDPQLDLTLSWTQVKPVYDKILRQVAKNLKTDGFRPGKVPLSVAADKVDQQYLIQEVVLQLAPAALQEALKTSQIKPFAEPELVIVKAQPDTDWQLTAYFPQKPDIKLPADYKKFLRQHKQEIKKKLQQLNAQALKDKEAKQPLLNDQQLQAKATDQALMELLTSVKPQISAALVRRSTRRELEKLQHQLEHAQLSMDDYLRQTNMTEAVLSQQLMFAALQNLQLEFILDALLEAEQITVSETEVQEKLKELLPEVTDVAEQKRQLEEQTVRDYLELMAKRQKLAHWLLEI